MLADAKSGPVAMFVDHTDETLTQTERAAGVSACVVNGLQKDHIKPVLETAIARLRVCKKMQSELHAPKRALSDRKIIDRAKGILMRARQISEEEAYTLLREATMGQRF